MRKSKHIIDDLVKPIMLEIVATAKAAGVELPTDIAEVSIKIDPVDDDFLLGNFQILHIHSGKESFQTWSLVSDIKQFTIPVAPRDP